MGKKKTVGPVSRCGNKQGKVRNNITDLGEPAKMNKKLWYRKTRPVKKGTNFVRKPKRRIKLGYTRKIKGKSGRKCNGLEARKDRGTVDHRSADPFKEVPTMNFRKMRGGE